MHLLPLALVALIACVGGAQASVCTYVDHRDGTTVDLSPLTRSATQVERLHVIFSFDFVDCFIIDEKQILY